MNIIKCFLKNNFNCDWIWEFMHVDANFDELYHRLVELIICQVGSTVDYMLHNNNNTH